MSTDNNSKHLKRPSQNFKINALKLIFNYAYKMGDIKKYNPVKQILLFKKDTREKGIETDYKFNGKLNNKQDKTMKKLL